MAKEKIIVKQTRSSNRHPKQALLTLKALGLGRIGREVEHEVTPSVLGMVKAVSHLVEINRIK